MDRLYNQYETSVFGCKEHTICANNAQSVVNMGGYE